MKRLTIGVLGFFIASNLFAAAVPPEISDDYMKVSTTALVMQLLPETFYNLKTLGVQKDPSKNDLVGSWAGLKISDGTCMIVASWTDSVLCPSTQNCQIQGTAISLPSCDFSTSSFQTSLARIQSMRLARYKQVNKCVSSARGAPSCSRYWVSK